MRRRRWSTLAGKAKEAGLFAFGCLGVMLAAMLALMSVDAPPSADLAASTTALSAMFATAAVMPRGV